MAKKNAPKLKPVKKPKPGKPPVIQPLDDDGTGGTHPPPTQPPKPPTKP